MKSAILAFAIMTPPPFNPIAEELTNPWYKPTPPPAESLKRVPWTLAGGQFLIESAREMCQGLDALTKCESVGGGIDRGFSVHDKKTGKFMFYMDRAIAEEVQQDYAATRRDAQEHHPYSNQIAKLEAQKSQWEYVGIACNTAMGPYCGAMAAKMKKFKETLIALCAGGLGVCQKFVTDKKAEIDAEINRILKACAISDQACFDAITGGQETQAALEFQNEINSGARPPHTPSRPGHRPMFLPGGDVTGGSWDSSCEKCKVYDGDDAENY